MKVPFVSKAHTEETRASKKVMHMTCATFLYSFEVAVVQHLPKIFGDSFERYRQSVARNPVFNRT